jgi:acyl-CoA thioester hydrolase
MSRAPRTRSLELGAVTDRKRPFKYSAVTRVAFSDTDAQGVVYYGRYMPYFDRAWNEYMRHLDLLRGRDGDFVMRAVTVEYFAPARFDDLLEIFVRAARIGRTSVTHEHSAYKIDGDELLATARQTLVYVDRRERAARFIPDVVRERILEFEGSDVER